MRTLARVTALVALATVPATLQAQAAQQAAATPAPTLAVGEMAPDFTAPVAGKNGIAAAPLTLSKLRGKVVVLAFYPGDRTRGCTIQLTKYTQEYNKLFGNDVVLLGISKDGLDSHASWAKELSMPFDLISDTTGTVARLFGSQGRTPTAGFARKLYVIGKDGKITYAVPSFNVNSEDAYTEMANAIAAAKK
jgi:peroxiredoxin Q/BCP